MEGGGLTMDNIYTKKARELAQLFYAEELDNLPQDKYDYIYFMAKREVDLEIIKRDRENAK